jgi:predicted ATPase
LERAAAFARDNEAEARCQKLVTLLGPATEAGDISLLLELLSLPGGDRFPPLELSPQSKKQHTFLALLRQLEGLARTQPVLLIFEDLHWIDPTSREFLDLALRRIEHLAVLLIATFRPEFQTLWAGQPHYTNIALNRLGRADGAAMVERVAGKSALLPPDVIADIVERTDGVPLFVEEVTKAVLEAGAEHGLKLAASLPSAGLGVPATLQASLMARLDRLGAAARGVAQIGAAIGREFSYELAASVSELAGEKLRDALQRLVDAGLVFQRGAPPAAEYLFKHALVQDAAYGTLLRGTRQQLHASIAVALEANFPDRVAREPEALGRHFSEAKQPDRALRYWLAAGERAIRRSGNHEAIGHLTAGLAQLSLLPDTTDRTKQELALQRLLGQANFHAKGLGAVDTDRAFSRARELCDATDDDQSIIQVLFGIIVAEWGAGHFAKAEATANEILRRAKRTSDPGAAIAGDFAVAATRLQSGNPARARAHFDRAIASFRGVEADAANRFAYDYGIELGSFSYAYGGWCWWLLGYPDQGVGLTEEAIAVGERVRHDYSRSRALYCKSVVHAFRREWEIVEGCAVAAIAIAQDRGLGMMEAVARIMLAAAQAMQRTDHESAGKIRQAIALYRATGTKIQSTHHLSLLAQALAACGHYSEGLAVLREAADLIEETGERYVEAEIHRLKGDLVLAGNGRAEAEACYVRALEVARSQEARSFELRSATSLARLWGEQGRNAQARELLAPVFGWFTEGFDTADLKEAKALLNELM